MKIHILGISGTFMSSIALLAKQSGHEVSGCDANIYPPMSDQLHCAQIPYNEGYDPRALPKQLDCVIVGNVIKRGNPVVERVLAEGIPYCSGPEWLARYILPNKKVLAVAGTHGKTTTASMLAWILTESKTTPSFLIGGIPENFGVSAKLGQSPYFVIEADEYDSAFFDKRSKFMHYRPQTLILNNLEFDHADIFANLDAIKQQFHGLIRTVPNNGLIIQNAADQNLRDMLLMGCWTPVVTFGDGDSQWQAKYVEQDGSVVEIYEAGKSVGILAWSLIGNHNVMNALAALAAARHVGIPINHAIAKLASFKNVKRRLEVKGTVQSITIYDDFAHHPTAIATTLAGLRAKIGRGHRLIVILEFGSYTMRTGTHKEKLQSALKEADMVVFKKTECDWGLSQLLSQFQQPAVIYDGLDALVQGVIPVLKSGDHVVVMSNTAFGGIHQKLLTSLNSIAC